MTEARLAKDGVTLNWTPPDQPVLAMAGEVRLAQVLVNLITNAADAMTGEVRELTLSLTDTPRPTIRVADTGTGIAQPERIFDPFYSTKEVGAAKGMGLGLSISYGMVQSFGGEIRGANRPEGGAEFVIELPAVPDAMVAE
jgi:two-component system C4-dicarboxylate transport sensor histidine kinase DctB